jgi:tetratricopeptide (TPR) repeat protein
VEAVNRETEGNPFFVEEVFQHLNEAGQLFDTEGQWKSGLEVDDADVPSGVRLVIDRRLERLSEEARRVLATAAVIGRGFGYRVVAATSDLDPDALLDAVDIAERAQLIVATTESVETTFAFTHELIRQSLLADLSLPRRQNLHLRVADALEQSYGDHAIEHAAELAHHLFMAREAADPARAARYLSLAGDLATDAAAYEDALGSYEAALSLQPEEDRRARAQLLSRVGLTHQTLGHWGVAMDTFGQAVDTFEAISDGPGAAGLCYRMAYLLLWLGKFQEALEVSARGLTALGDQRTGERSSLLGLCGAAFSSAGGHDAGLAMITEALEIATVLGDRALLAQGKNALMSHHWMYGRWLATAEVGYEAIDLLRAERKLWDLAQVLGFVALAELFRGQRTRALEIHQELEPLGRKLGHFGAQIMDKRTTLLLALAAGDLDVAENAAQQDLELCLANHLPWYRESFVFLASVAFARGHWERAVELCLQAGEHDVPTVQAPLEPSALFMYLAYAGKQEEAMHLLGRLREEMEPGEPNGMGAWDAALSVAEGLIAMGELATAAEFYPLVEATISELGWVLRPRDARSTQIVAAITAAAGEMWDRAEEHFRLARIDAEGLGARSVADCDYFEAWALQQRGADGDHERAQALLADAILSYRRLGMPRHVALAEDLSKLAGQAVK